MKKLMALVSAVSLGLTALAAATGSCPSKAAKISIGSSKTVTLVNEWDGEDYMDYGVYYFSVTLKRGSAYTLCLEPISGELSDFDLTGDPREETEAELDRDIYAPTASFGGQCEQDGKLVCWIDAEDWDPEDQASWKYYLSVTGEIGARAKVSLYSGHITFLAEGLEENPAIISMRDTSQTASKKFTEENSFFFKTTLTANRKYLVRTVGGTEAAKFDLSVETDDEMTVEDDPAYAEDKNNTAWIVYPQYGGVYTFVVTGGQQGQNFQLVYQSVPTRPIAKHPTQPIAVGAPLTLTPGRLVADADYYDEIPDEYLLSATYTRGERYVFDAKGADRPIRIVAFDTYGKMIASNESVDGESNDVRLSLTATATAGYIGVYDPALTITDTPVSSPVTVTMRVVEDKDEEHAVSPLPGTEGQNPRDGGAKSGPYELTDEIWNQVFVIGGRKGITYSFETRYLDEHSPLTLAAEVYTLSGTTERKVTATGSIDPDGSEPLSFTATANATYYVRVSVKEGVALDYPEFYLFALATTDGKDLGILTVNAFGTPDARWYVDRESSTLYPSGTSILIGGTHTVNFKSVTNFNSPAAIADVTVAPGTTPTVRDAFYSDKNDPADDYPSGSAMIGGKKVTYKPVSWSLKNTETSFNRTLWTNDVADVFTFDGVDGNLYDFSVVNRGGGDARITITNATPYAKNKGIFVLDATNAVHLVLPKLKTKYFLTVHHALGTEAPSNGYYTVSGSFAKIGAIKFSKTAVSSKNNAASVKLSVRRTAKDGRVRVRYQTIAGTAKPGERYVAQSGVLDWAANDNKTKEIVIKLIPDLVAYYKGDTQFEVRLEPYGDESELEPGEYPALISTETCVITLTDAASKTVKSIEEAYAKTAPKAATVKTENVALRAGTFYGVLSEDGSALTNGFPQLASVTLTTTVKDGKNDSLSAKVALAGKTYTFKTDVKNPATYTWTDLGGDLKEITLPLVQTVNKVAYTNELTLTIQDGSTTNGTDWAIAGGHAVLWMNVPDANNKGVQEEICYTGDLFRQNAKIQNYFNVVTNFTGYYTLALAPQGVSSADGIPAGNGYLTLTVDNKGTAKVAGLLADNTSVSLSVTAAGIRADETSANGYAMYLPLFVAKSPYCFGGLLRLYAKPGQTLPNKDYEIVVDSVMPLVWNNDNAKLTYYNEDGWRILLDPCGGWYDKVVNLQAYYLNYALEVGGADITEFPTEVITTADYGLVADVQPAGFAAEFAGDTVSVAKKSLVKDGKLYDLVKSVNPNNVQIKLARATGLVSGSFSVWSEKDDGSAQKEITGFSHKGVLLLARDAAAPLGEEVLSAGFVSKAVKVSGRSWTFSLPFNLLAIDQGEIDWWEEDGGWNTEWGEAPTEEQE